MHAIKMLHFPERDLTGSGCGRYGRVSELATFPQREQARRKPDFAHRNRYAVAHACREAKQPHAVADGTRRPGHLDGVEFIFPAAPQSRDERGHAIEIVHRKQDALRQRMLANRISLEMTKCFDLEIAPEAASFRGLRKPMKFGLDTASK